MEFNVKIRVNTQSPEIGYEHLRAALSFNGLVAEVNDIWFLNNRPLPIEVARQVDDAWKLKSKNIDSNITIRRAERFEDRYVETENSFALAMENGNRGRRVTDGHD